MIKNLRLLTRGLEADVEIGTDKHGTRTFVHVTVPLEAIADELAALTAKFEVVAAELVTDQVVNAKVRKQVESIRIDVAKAERERLRRDAGAENERVLSRLALLQAELDTERRHKTEARTRSNEIAVQLDQVRRELDNLRRSQDSVGG